MGRMLGIDYGEKRIGLALSDPCGILATPFKTIDGGTKGEVVGRVLSECIDVDIERIIVGYPKNMDGSIGPSGRKVEEFTALLREKAKCPVNLWDERLSTCSAERVLIEAGTRREKRKKVIDKLAAQIILQSYIDATCT